MTRSPVHIDVFTSQRISPDEKSLWTVGDTATAADGYLVGPAFFDPQVNGFGGVDFQDPHITSEALEHVVAGVRRAGCSHFLLTLITNSAEFLEEQFARIGGF